MAGYVELSTGIILMTYSCYNLQPFQRAEIVQDGWVDDHADPYPSRKPVMAVVRHRMTRDCQYTHDVLGRADPQCVGCRHRAP